MDPCGTPDLILSHELKELFTYALCLRAVRQLCMNWSELSSKQYASNLANTTIEGIIRKNSKKLAAKKSEEEILGEFLDTLVQVNKIRNSKHPIGTTK